MFDESILVSECGSVHEGDVAKSSRLLTRLLQLAEGFPHHADDASCVGEGVEEEEEG